MTDRSEWQGRVGDVWAQEWRRTDRSFADLSPVLDAAVAAAAPAGAFRALDIGCGAGGTILALQTARPDASIVGIDLSEGLAAVARERVAGAQILIGDAAALAVEHGPFDLLYSRHGVMFFADPVAGFTALRRAAGPGASLIFSCFRARGENAWLQAIEAALGAEPAPEAGYAPGPFGLADEDFTAQVLRDAGWANPHGRAVDYRYIAGSDVDDALSFLGRIGPAARVLATADEKEKAAMRARLRDTLEHHLGPDGVTFPAAAWIWTATAAEEAR